MVDAALENAATMTMRSNLHAICRHCVINELIILRRELVQALLNDVIAIQILNQNDNGEAECNNNGMDLGVAFGVSLPRPVSDIKRISDQDSAYLSACREEIDHLLDSTSAMHIEGDIDKVLRHRFTNDVSLIICRIFQELLAEIVTERIYMQKLMRHKLHMETNTYRSLVRQSG